MMKKKMVAVILLTVAATVNNLLTVAATVNNANNIEKTETLKFPSIISEGRINENFDDECEAWLNQNIPFRGQLLSNINILLSDVLHNPTANVVTGSDGWVYSTETIDDYMDTNSMSQDDIRDLGISLSLMQEGVKAKGGNFVFAPVPNKNSIYSEYMPNRYLKASENNLTRIYKEMDARGINYVNLKDQLLEAKTSENPQQLYYKRDTHWTIFGANLAYESIMEGLGKEPNVYDLSEYSTDYSKRGDLDKLLYPMLDRRDVEYTPASSIDYDSFVFIRPADVSDNKAQLENFMSDKEDHDNNFSTKKKKHPDNSSLYMIRDSFARAMLPYFIDSYNEATFVRTTSPSIANIPSGSDVVYEICERNLKNLLKFTPFMYAPKRDSQNLLFTIHDSGLNRFFYEDEGYAIKIYGTIDSSMLGQDGRILVRISDNESTAQFYEAFPICEEDALRQALSEENINLDDCKKEGAKGFSLYLDKGALGSNSYEVSLASGNKESSVLGTIEIVEATGESVEEEEIALVNPYAEENTMHQLLYRGVTIGIGDNINSLKDALGNQAAPSEVITSCLSGTDAVMYYYPSITLETDMDGLIYYISLMDNSYLDGKEAPVTESGIGIGSNKMDIWDKLGSPSRENDKNCSYFTEHLNITYSYKNGEVTSVILEDNKYSSSQDSSYEEEEKIPGVEYESGNTYLYDDTHIMKTGWQIIDGEYYFFDRITGERILGQTVDGIDIGEDGQVNLSEYDKKKIETMMKAHEIMLENTNPTDTMEEKRRKVFDWVLSFPYHQYRHFKEVYNDEGIEIIEANDIFDEGAGDCVSESAALAFLFHEIGYNNVYWVHDTGHSWVRSDDKLFDPLFAESRDFDANYDAEFKDYRKTMDHSMLIY